MTEKKSNDQPRYGAYDHLKKEVAKKKKTKAAAAGSAGVPTVVKVFFISVILFGGLLFGGVLTNDPFDDLESDAEQFRGTDIPEGNSNIQALTELCVNHEGSLSAHYHFDLFLFIDEQERIVPANVGIESSSCMRPVHTHADDGHIHIELPSSYTGALPNVGDFFQIWEEDFTSSSLLGQSGEVTMTVNGEIKSGSLPSYVPADGDEVRISLVTN